MDDRNKMTELERLRHSCAHVLATAILRLWPDAQFASGPAVENGFYYDVDLQHRISPEDFPAIEAEMKKEIKSNHTFEKLVVTREQAIKDSESGRLGGLTERPGNPSPTLRAATSSTFAPGRTLCAPATSARSS